MRQIMHRRNNINLKEELKALMFSISSGPICITDDKELFMNVMIIFYQHEQTVSWGGREGGREEGGGGGGGRRRKGRRDAERNEEEGRDRGESYISFPPAGSSW